MPLVRMEQAESLIAKRYQPRANRAKRNDALGILIVKENRPTGAKALQSIRLLGLQPELILARCKPRVTLPLVALPWAGGTIGLSARS